MHCIDNSSFNFNLSYLLALGSIHFNLKVKFGAVRGCDQKLNCIIQERWLCSNRSNLVQYFQVFSLLRLILTCLVAPFDVALGRVLAYLGVSIAPNGEFPNGKEDVDTEEEDEYVFARGPLGGETVLD